MVVVASLYFVADYSGARQSVLVLIALLVCLIPTTIGALLSAIGIAGMDRLVRRNVLAMSGRAVEAAGDVDVLLLDKTGTITFGNRQATELLPLTGRLRRRAGRGGAARPRSPTRRPRAGASSPWSGATSTPWTSPTPRAATLVEFSATTRMSGLDLPGRTDPQGRRLGGGEVGAQHGAPATSEATAELDALVDRVSRTGGTPLVVAEQVGAGPAGCSASSTSRTSSRTGMRERFDEMRAMGIRTVMITGDNAVTAAAIAAEAGVDDVLAEATPEDKLALIRKEQEGGRMVAMCGDGTNDAPALAQADVGVAMNTGTTAAKEAGNMVDLDSDPTKLIDVVEIGKQLLITRGALTTFSVANDVAKYFAILPGDVRGGVPGPRRPQRHAAVVAGVGDPLGRRVQRADHRAR